MIKYSQFQNRKERKKKVSVYGGLAYFIKFEGRSKIRYLLFAFDDCYCNVS